MKHLVYKDFRLAIHPLILTFPLFGALLLIPEWPYFIALMYFFFIAVPNIFTSAKAQGDIDFSAMLPVRRSDIVRSRILSISLIELMVIIVSALFGAINLALYPKGNFLLDTNAAFFGFAFMMYGIHNLIFFPMFYKSAYKIAAPTIAAVSAVIIFAAAVESAVQLVPFFKVLDGTKNITAQLFVLLGGIVIFILLSLLSSKLSVKRFERISI